MQDSTASSLAEKISKGFKIILFERRIPGKVISTYYRALRRLGIKTVTLKTRDGLVLSCFSSSVSIFVEVFQKEDYNFEGFDWNDKIVVDIGANQGFSAIYAASRGAHVYAFEPCAENLAMLERNVATNSLQDHISVYDAAVTGKDREVRLFVGLDGEGDHLSGSASIVNEDRGGTGVRKQIVKGIPINDLFEDLGIERCDLLKMDCEGAEYEILDHLQDDMLGLIENIAIEFHDGRADQILDRLTSAGFEILKSDEGKSGLIKASKSRSLH